MPSEEMTAGKAVTLCIAGLALTLACGLEQRRMAPLRPIEHWSDRYVLSGTPHQSYATLGSGRLEHPDKLGWWSQKRQDIRETFRAKAETRREIDKLKQFSALQASDKVKGDERIPSKLEADYYRACYLEGEGEFEQALEIFDSLQKKGGGIYVEIKRVACLAQLGRTDEAIQEADRIAGERAQSPVVLLNLGSIYLRAGQPDKGEDSFKRAVNLDPRLKSTQLDLARYLASQGRWDEARELYEAFMENPIQRQLLQPHLELAEIMVKQGDTEGGRQLLQNLANAQPRKPAVVLPLVRLLVAKGAHEEALGQLRQLLAADPMDPEALLNVAAIQMEMDNYDGCLQTINILLQLDPQDGRIIGLRGDLSYKMGRMDEAEAYYRQALLFNPSLAGASNNLAWLLLEQNKDLKEAMGFAKQSTAFESQNPAGYKTLAAILEKLGQSEEAKAAQAQADALEGNVPPTSR